MVISWDTTGISVDDFPVAPEGLQEMEIVSAEEKKRASGRDGIDVVCKIIESVAYTGIKLIHYLTIMKQGENGAGIAKKFIKVIGEPWDGKIKIVPEKWRGKKFTAYLIVEEYKGTNRNKIKWFKEYEGSKVQTEATPSIDASKPDEVPF